MHPTQRHQTISRLDSLLLLCSGAVLVVVLEGLTRTFAHGHGSITGAWTAGGICFALLAHNVRAVWWITTGAVALAWVAAPHGSPHMLAFGLLANLAGPWLAWRLLRTRFATTSQPFSRQHTTLAFLRAQTLFAAPLSAAIMTVGTVLSPFHSGWHDLAGMFATSWAASACSAMLLAAPTWELLASHHREGVRKFVSRQVRQLANDRQIQVTAGLWVATIVLVGLDFGWLALAGLLGCMVLLPQIALRTPPVTAHGLVLLVGAASLGVLSRLMARLLPAGWAPELLADLWVLAWLFALQLLLVTAHERRLALKRLDRQAETDPLTNLLSLSGLYRRLEDMADRSDGDSRPSGFLGQGFGIKRPALVSVHMTNADSLEQLLGSRQCDVVERATSGALTTSAPQVTWARVSKAHFVGVLADCRDDLHTLLTQLNFTVQDARTLVDENIVRPTWAVAAVTLETEPLPPIEVAMACLRRAEQTALDTRQIVVHPVDEASGYALRMEAEQAERIRQIIQQKRLLLFAQPIVANQSPGKLRHKYEILIRLQDEQGTVIPPALFLPIAMRAGLMQALDSAVIEQTFEWFAANPAALSKLSHCAINLSGPTVAHPGVAAGISALLVQHGLPPEKFTFEITESQAIANPEQASATIRAIRAGGCRVAIDDFGTGVATFDYLKRFDVDYIKIDGAFITSLMNDPVDRVIVESIVKVARQLGVRTIAEYVSSQELHAAVTALGVDESQGYAFGAPRPLQEWFG